MTIFERIKEDLSDENIISILSKFGVHEYRNESNFIVFPTVCHNAEPDEGSMKLYYYKDNRVFKCYTECDCIYDIFSLIQKIMETRGETWEFFKVVDFIVGETDFSTEDFTPKYKSARKKYQTQKIKLEICKKNPLEMFIEHLPAEWEAEGILEKSLQRYEVKYSPSQNKAVLPHFNIEGELIGIRGRAFDSYEVENFGKYRPMYIEGTLYSHPLSLNLYGLNVSKAAIERSKTVILFEGEKSCLLYDGYFYHNISAAACGSTINKHQIKLLIRNFNLQEIIIAFDKEYKNPFGKDGEIYFKKLMRMGRKYSQYCNFSFLFDTEGFLKEKDSPIDRGPEVFLRLVEKRIKVRN